MASTSTSSSTAFFLLLALSISTATSTPSTGELNYTKQWCIADEQTPDETLQMALDWACGMMGGADCRMIQERKACYEPNTVRDHASYAFNGYWQKYKSRGGSCFFNSAAMVTDKDPSHGSCKFEFLP